MALNVRLSDKLESRARGYCEDLGISLNALISIALDAYIKDAAPTSFEGQNEAKQAPPVGNHGDNNQAPPGPDATKKERQAWTAFQRKQRKLPLEA